VDSAADFLLFFTRPPIFRHFRLLLANSSHLAYVRRSIRTQGESICSIKLTTIESTLRNMCEDQLTKAPINGAIQTHKAHFATCLALMMLFFWIFMICLFYWKRSFDVPQRSFLRIVSDIRHLASGGVNNEYRLKRLFYCFHSSIVFIRLIHRIKIKLSFLNKVVACTCFTRFQVF